MVISTLCALFPSERSFEDLLKVVEDLLKVVKRKEGGQEKLSSNFMCAEKLPLSRSNCEIFTRNEHHKILSIDLKRRKDNTVALYSNN